jgi:competence protein ComEC
MLSCYLVEKKGLMPVRVRGRIRLNIYDKQGQAFQFGDLIQFTSPLKPFRNFSNPKGFDYEKHMLYAGVYGSAYAKASKIRLLLHPIGVHVRIIRILENLRTRFFKIAMDKMENKDVATILAALVTGQKEAIPPWLKEVFSKAGASHILAISGLHLSIIALGFFSILYFLLARFPLLLISGKAKKTAGILTLIPLFFYGVFSGFSPSTQRAFIMTAIFMISFLGERENNPLNTLALSALVILVIDCGALFSISFQLSFSALFFIILGFSLIKISGWNRPKNPMTMIITSALVTFFAGLGTFPLIAHYFHLVSYVQILSNLILIPVIGFICLPLGFISCLLIPVVPGLSYLLISICEPLLLVCIKYIDFLTGFKFSWSRIIAFDGLKVILVYLFLGGVCLILARRKKTGIAMMTMVVLISCFDMGPGLNTKSIPKKIKITILDVGQGNSAVIQTMTGKNILVDGGGFPGVSSFDIGRHVLGPFLWSQGILCLDAVVLTHPESDHMNGLVYIFRNFKVNLLIKNKDTASSHTYWNLMDLCREKKIRIWHPSSKDSALQFDHTRLVFFPGIPGAFQDNRNNNSLVFKVRLNKFTLLFPGDILKQREMALIRPNGQDKDLQSSLLISPHHGSMTSSSKIFLDKVNPESVIISCGFGNPYGFPHPDVLKRYTDMGYTVFRTDINGAVTISSDGIGYNILTHKGG